jgi:hypothetical protein
MTLIYQYLEGNYLNDLYLTNFALGSTGIQSQFVINDQKFLGIQKKFEIIDYLHSLGVQSQFVIDASVENALQGKLIINSKKPVGLQKKLVINYFDQIGIQAEFLIEKRGGNGIQTEFKINSQDFSGVQFLADLSKGTSYGLQFQKVILSNLKNGVEFRADKYPSSECAEKGYLSDSYLSDPYLTAIWCMRPGLQTEFKLKDKIKPTGIQSKFVINTLANLAIQTQFKIVDKLNALGLQFICETVYGSALQFLATIYNTNNLRILSEFPSRGVGGLNWTANSTATGDFAAENLDTDVVEQIWRSVTGITTGINLTTDTGLPQGSYIDTMAILGHNMTRSATINLIGSNDPTFGSIGIVIPIQAREENIYYIAEELPTQAFRYWRISIDDVSNPNNFVSIGSIIFGSSRIFQGECFVDEIEFELKDYADTVRTEGFTNVSNSRSLKRKVRLEFRSLDSNLNNFKTMRSLFQTYRTTHKCLWIPTPDPTDQEITARFAVYGKLSVIPSERHNSKGPKNNYVTFTIEIDESL